MIRFRPLVAPTLMVVPALALLVGLGVWQVQRLHWKLGLIAAVDARVNAAPIPLDAALMLPPDQAEWRKVRVDGHFLHDKEAYLFAPGKGGEPGIQVITPLVRASGRSILVDRGFVPDALRDPTTRAAGQVMGEVSVVGILREPQVPGWFTPKPDLKTRLWFIKNAPSVAAASGLTLDAPVMIEADASPNPGGFPRGGQTIVDFPNSHLQYAITWFGLALALLAVYLVYHHRQGRLRFGSRTVKR